MPQLHLYLPQDQADEVRRRAEHRKVSVSCYLAEVVRQELASGWPEGFMEGVAGAWQGEPLSRPDQGEWEVRQAW